MIGRIPVISLSPQQSELYYMRMLLYHKPGATGFEDLRTIKGHQEATYRAACLRLGLLDDDAEIDKVMEEVSSIRFGPHLREVFATVLMWIQPNDPLSFWHRHINLLCEDLMHKENVLQPTDAIVNQVLFDLQTIVERNGYNLSDHYGLPQPDLTL